METNNMFYDKDFRHKIRDLDHGSLAALMTDSIGDIEVKVLTNSKDTLYFIIPDKGILDTGDLSGVQAAGLVGASTAGTHSTVGSIGSLTTTAGTVGTVVGTASSVGCLS